MAKNPLASTGVGPEKAATEIEMESDTDAVIVTDYFGRVWQLYLAPRMKLICSAARRRCRSSPGVYGWQDGCQ